MPTPVDMLLGPVMRLPQHPREGEAPGAHKPYSPLAATFGVIGGALALGLVVRAVARGANDAG